MIEVERHAHYWTLRRYERFIACGQCSCRAVRFFANDLDPAVAKRVEELNETLGKEGNMAPNKDLPREERERVTQELTNDESAVPPKPSGAYRTGKYYDTNKEAILRDLEALGEEAMRKRWHISQATWFCRREDGTSSGIAARWGLVEVENRVKKSEKREKHDRHPQGKKSTDNGSPMTSEQELWYLRGYRTCLELVMGRRK